MCGRYYLKKMIDSELFEMLFGFPLQSGAFSPILDEDILPYRDITVIHGTERQQAAMRAMFWNLIPKDAPKFEPTRTWFNTRSEKLEEPYQRNLLRYRRCAVPVNGFFENKKVNGKAVYHDAVLGGRRVRKKESYEFVHRDQPVMLLGGIYEKWRGASEVRFSCSIITLKPNSLIGEVHDRMPFILPNDVVKIWLDRRVDDADLLVSMIAPYPSEKLQRKQSWPPTMGKDQTELFS